MLPTELWKGFLCPLKNRKWRKIPASELFRWNDKQTFRSQTIDFVLCEHFAHTFNFLFVLQKCVDFVNCANNNLLALLQLNGEPWTIKIFCVIFNFVYFLTESQSLQTKVILRHSFNGINPLNAINKYLSSKVIRTWHVGWWFQSNRKLEIGKCDRKIMNMNKLLAIHHFMSIFLLFRSLEFFSLISLM